MIVEVIFVVQESDCQVTEEFWVSLSLRWCWVWLPAGVGWTVFEAREVQPLGTSWVVCGSQLAAGWLHWARGAAAVKRSA